MLRLQWRNSCGFPLGNQQKIFDYVLEEKKHEMEIKVELDLMLACDFCVDVVTLCVN